MFKCRCRCCCTPDLDVHVVSLRKFGSALCGKLSICTTFAPAPHNLEVYPKARRSLNDDNDNSFHDNFLSFTVRLSALQRLLAPYLQDQRAHSPIVTTYTMGEAHVVASQWRLVERGRVVLFTTGKYEGRLATIAEIIDHKRVRRE